MSLPRPALALLAAFLAASAPAAAADWLDLSGHSWSFVAEGGARFTPSLNISGAHQGNATRNWDGTAASVRAEAWLTRPDALSLGLVLAPLDQTFRGTTTSPLDSRGKHFAAGGPATLNFQFPSARVTANYPIWSSASGAELRLGVSLIARYADETLKSGSTRLRRTNLIALPLLNAEGSVPLGGSWSGILRADVLPAEAGTGLYDAFLGVRYTLTEGRAVEVGSRTFYGGYHPNKANDLNNKILAESVVVRLVF